MDGRQKIGFAGAVGALLALYFASGSPIPLYSMYQEQLGLTHSQLSMASMWYLLGTVVPLLFLPRISDHLGRRPVAIMILMVSLCGCMTFACISRPEMLMAGRLIQGFASGLGSSSIAAYVVDLSSDLPRWVGPTITSSAPTLGLAAGAFISGGLVQYADADPASYFYAVMAAIAIFAVVIVFARETVPRRPGVLRSLVPRLTLPESSGRLFAASAMVFIGTWSLGGFSQSFSSAIAAEHFGHQDAFLSAAVFTALLLPNVIGSFFAKRFEVRSAQRIGMGMFAGSAILMFASLSCGILSLFLAFSVVAGIGQGIAFTGSVTELLSRAGQDMRAGTFSTIYLTSYGGAAIPNFVVGMIPGDYATTTIMSGYVVLTAVMFLIMLALSAKPYPAVQAREVLSERPSEPSYLQDRQLLEEQLQLSDSTDAVAFQGILQSPLLHQR